MTRYVLITRHPAECQEFQDLLRPAGIVVRPYPVLRLEEVHDRRTWRRLLARLADAPGKSPLWLVFASPRAPERLAVQAAEHGASKLSEMPAAAVGSATAEAARQAGFRVEVEGPGTGQALAEQLCRHWKSVTTAVFACGHERRAEMPTMLERAGHKVMPLELYRMRPTPTRELPPLGPSLDAVVLTSPRSTQYYLEGVGGFPLPCQHWGLGPTTQMAAQALGIDCLIPPEPTLKSLAEELCKT